MNHAGDSLGIRVRLMTGRVLVVPFFLPRSVDWSHLPLYVGVHRRVTRRTMISTGGVRVTLTVTNIAKLIGGAAAS